MHNESAGMARLQMLTACLNISLSKLCGNETIHQGPRTTIAETGDIRQTGIYKVC